MTISNHETAWQGLNDFLRGASPMDCPHTDPDKKEDWLQGAIMGAKVYQRGFSDCESQYQEEDGDDADD